MNIPSIGIKIKELRKAKKLTQKQLAEKIGKVESTVRMWELGKNQPLPEALKSLSEVLEVEHSYLMQVAGYLEEKTKFETLAADYIKNINSIKEITRLIMISVEEKKHLNMLLESDQKSEEKDLLISHLKHKIKEFAKFTELLPDFISTKERIEKELEIEKTLITKELKLLLKTINYKV